MMPLCSTATPAGDMGVGVALDGAQPWVAQPGVADADPSAQGLGVQHGLQALSSLPGRAAALHLAILEGRHAGASHSHGIPAA